MSLLAPRGNSWVRVPSPPRARAPLIWVLMRRPDRRRRHEAAPGPTPRRVWLAGRQSLGQEDGAARVTLSTDSAGYSPRPVALPVLTAAELRRLRELPKVVPDDWRHQVRPVDAGAAEPNLKGTLQVVADGLDVGTRLSLYTRVTKARPRDFSCGLLYQDSAGNTYPLVRCNGHHARHPNRLEGTSIPAVTPHVHYVTEKYLRAGQQGRRVEPDGWAIRGYFGNLDGALAVLARRVRLLYNPNLLDQRNLP